MTPEPQGDGWGWRIAPIGVRSPEGWHEIPGWTNGLFCLDWRTYIEEDDIGRIFAITHAATGYTVASVEGSFAEAQAFVAILTEAGDWTFTEAGDAKRLGVAFAEAKAAFEESHPGAPVIRGKDGMFPKGAPAHADAPVRS